MARQPVNIVLDQFKADFMPEDGGASGDDAAKPSVQGAEVEIDDVLGLPVLGGAPLSFTGAGMMGPRVFTEGIKEMEEARIWREEMVKLGRLRELNCADVELFGYKDRFEVFNVDDKEDALLLDSIRTSGQAIPALVRPHPDIPGRFQIVNGRRRWWAVKLIGNRKFLVVVKEMDDNQVRLNQALENIGRKNLRFIEAAMAAYELEAVLSNHGAVAAHLAIDRTLVCKYLKVASPCNHRLIRAIGATSRGRPSWERLLAAVYSSRGLEEALLDYVETDGFSAAKPDDRFSAVVRFIDKWTGDTGQKIKSLPPSAIPVECGGKIVANRIPVQAGIGALEFDEKQFPGLSEFVAQKMSELLDEYQASRLP